jgi:hypothetical protein
MRREPPWHSALEEVSRKASRQWKARVTSESLLPRLVVIERYQGEQENQSLKAE